MKKWFFLLWGLALLIIACNSPGSKNTAEQADSITPLSDSAFAEIFSKHGVRGTFVLYELNAKRWTVYNEARADSAFLPASTFKIPNSLIALETEVIKDEQEIIPWDGVQRMSKSWNRDHHLRSAIKVSAVWFYQELARRIGPERMQQWLDRFAYGNQKMGEEVDNFWLIGDLRIRPKEQIAFLEKLYRETLPCSPENMAIVKDILIQQQTADYTLRAKTGWAARVEPNRGWYVGWLEEGGEVYLFAMNIDILENKDANSRQEITEDVLKAMGLMGNGNR